MITADGNLIQLYHHFQPPGATLYAGVDSFPVRAMALPLGMYVVDHRVCPLSLMNFSGMRKYLLNKVRIASPWVSHDEAKHD